jgi:hypothetical protein
MRRKQRDLEHKLLLMTLPAFGQRLEDLEAAAQVADGFEIGRSLDREFASATPIVNCLRGQTRLSGMVG